MSTVTKNFKVQNNGESSATITDIFLTPSNTGISISNTPILPYILNPGQSVGWEIQATYTNAGTANCVMTVDHNLQGTPAQFPIQATFVPLIGAGSLYWAKVGSTSAYVNPISDYNFSDFTFQFWAYTPSSSPSDQFGRYVDNNFITGFAINHKSTLKICLEGASANIGLDSNDNAVSLDTWQAFAFRRSGNTVSILRNGVVIASTVKGSSSSLNIFGSGGVVRFGNVSGSELSSHYVSDWRMWNYALSDAQILANYNIRLTGQEPGLVAYYPLSETDSVFNDLTGNNVALTLVVGGLPSPPAPNLRYDSSTPPFI